MRQETRVILLTTCTACSKEKFQHISKAMFDIVLLEVRSTGYRTGRVVIIKINFVLVDNADAGGPLEAWKLYFHWRSYPYPK